MTHTLSWKNVLLLLCCYNYRLYFFVSFHVKDEFFLMPRCLDEQFSGKLQPTSATVLSSCTQHNLPCALSHKHTHTLSVTHPYRHSKLLTGFMAQEILVYLQQNRSISYCDRPTNSPLNISQFFLWSAFVWAVCTGHSGCKMSLILPVWHGEFPQRCSLCFLRSPFFLRSQIVTF